MSQLMEIARDAAKLVFAPGFLTIVKFGPHRAARRIKSYTFAQAMDQALMAGAEAPASVEVHDGFGLVVRFAY